MRNLHLTFSHPWVLLLLIPAIAFTLIPYFRLAKRYRRTRSRITSMVLHMIVMVMAVLTFSGLNFRYEKINKNNELVLLVDVSETENKVASDRDSFVEKVIKEAKKDNFKVGVVTFGYDQVYAAELNSDTDKVLEEYKESLKNKLPDTTATDIAAALRYTKDIFTSPESSKIVLVSDAKETDEDALNAIKYVAAQGTRVDTVYYGSNEAETEVAVTSIKLPDRHILKNEECSINATVKMNSAAVGTAERNEKFITAELYIDGENVSSQQVKSEVGTKDIVFLYSFTTDGLHKIEIRLTADGDTISENNSYCSYLYLEVYNKILIIEKEEGSSVEFTKKLTEQDKFNVTTLTVDSDDLPKTIDGLRAYDQIVLNNIANSDLKKIVLPGKTEAGGFDKILYSYVYDYGGGLLTTGGKNSDGTAHAYDKDDLVGSLFQDMLPVEATEYTPPLGVVVAIDTSGSMGSGTGSIKEWAFEGAISMIRHHLKPDRDYVGIITFATTATTRVPMTSAAQKKSVIEKIGNYIDSDDNGSSTNFTPAIELAGSMLNAVNNVSKKHVIIVTDGAPGDDANLYKAAAAENFGNDITLSVVITGTLNETNRQNMNDLLNAAGGEAEGCKLYVSQNPSDSVDSMAADINAPEISKLNPEEFNPIIADETNNIVRNLPREVDEDGNYTNKLAASVGGFYGTKLKSGASILLEGVIVTVKTVDGKEVRKENRVGVPLYAQWSLGKGKVGSFMSDIYGDWGTAFVQSEAGTLFFAGGEYEKTTTDAEGNSNTENVVCPGIVNSLMPTEDIAPKKIQLKISGDNYYKQVNVISSLNDGEKISASIAKVESYEDGNAITSEAVSLNSVSAGNGIQVSTALDKDNGFGRCSFTIKNLGIYVINLKKLDKDDNEIQGESETYYISFSYSEEYDVFETATEEDLKKLMLDLADKGKGKVIEGENDSQEIFKTFVTGFERNFDPRMLFMIIAIVVFLLDIAVRKFKFKWIHEIIRDHKAKQAEKEKSKVQ